MQGGKRGFQFFAHGLLFFQLCFEIAFFFVRQDADRFVLVFQRPDVIRHIVLLVSAKYRSPENVFFFHLSVLLYLKFKMLPLLFRRRYK